MPEVEVRVRELLAERAPTAREPSKMLATETLTGDLGFDSIAFVALIVDIEQRFGLTLSDEALLEQPAWCESVGTLTQFIRALVDARSDWAT